MSTPPETTDDSAHAGRPTDYSEEMVKRARKYFQICKDSRTTVRMPSKGGLAVFLDVSRDTLYEWAKNYPAFSDIMEMLGAEQERRLIDKGLSGEYNPTIAKVLLAKQGYREGIDVTTNDKDLIDPKAKELSDRALNAFLNGNKG